MIKRYIYYIVLFVGISAGLPASAEERPLYPRNIKGFFETDVFTQVVSRRVVEDISPGEEFKGTAISTRVMVRIAVKPVRAVEFFIQGGAANLDVDEFNDFRGDYGAAYGGGLALTLYESPMPERFRMVLRGEGTRFEAEDKVTTFIGADPVYVEEEIRWTEYSIDGIGVWRVMGVEPYVGVRFSWIDAEDKIKDPRIGKMSLEEDRNLGMVIGGNIYLDPREEFAVNLEGSLIDQASFKIGVKIWY